MMSSIPHRLTATALTVMVSAASPAIAAVTPETYFFYAVVETASDGHTPQPGTVVSISVTVDSTFPAYSQRNHVTLYEGNADYPTPILAATINWQSVHGSIDSIAITQDPAGLYQIVINSASPQFGSGFNITLKPTMKGVVRTDQIPKKVFPGNFQSAAFTAYGYYPYGGGIID